MDFPWILIRELQSTDTNHVSGLQYLDHIENYITEECAFNAMYGPFQEPPITLHISPLMTRSKQNSEKRRTIMDLSWPKGMSVNDGVQRDQYLGTYFTLHYPSLDNITNALKQLGPQALIYKIDISRAFRHLTIDPGDIDLLGLKHCNYFIDGCLPFGFRHGSVLFQHCSDAIRHVMNTRGYKHFYNYIDDLIYIGLPHEIHQSFQFLQDLLKDLGLTISQDKLVPPSTSVVCLGIMVNTIEKTISIPEPKLQEIKQLCIEWTTKTYCSKRDLQSLLGSLLYITKCVRSSRFFLNHMLQLLRDNTTAKKILLTQTFFQDLNWFNTFLCQFNGITYYYHNKSDIQVHLDASLTALGGTYNSMVYSLPIPKNYKNYSIVHLEALNIVVAAKIWAETWANKQIHVFCDNMAVVEVLNTGKARDSILATCARNIWLISAMFNVQFQFTHISGKQNSLADLLSRWTGHSSDKDKLHALCPHASWIPTHVDFTLLNDNI